MKNSLLDTKTGVFSVALTLMMVLAVLFSFSPVLLSSGNAEAAEKKFLVGFPEDNMANDWRAAQVHELAAELKKYPNVRFIEADAKGQVARNLQDIEDMVEAGVDLLFLGPRDAELMTPVVKKLYRQGVKIVLLTRRILSEDFDVFISPNDFNIARDAATFLAKHLHGKGRILMLEGIPTATTAQQRSAGFMAGLKSFPGIQLAAVETGNYSRAGGIKAMESALQEGLKFDAVFSHNDAMLVGARLALKSAGIDLQSVPSVGIDYINEAREAIRNGEQTASFTYPICGKEGAQAAMKILMGKTIDKYIEVSAQIVTRENVEIIQTIY